jgi:hypothetical protein
MDLTGYENLRYVAPTDPQRLMPPSHAAMVVVVIGPAEEFLEEAFLVVPFFILVTKEQRVQFCVRRDSVVQAVDDPLCAGPGSGCILAP